MKTRTGKSVLTLAFSAIIAYGAMGQCKEWKWPEDKAKAEEAVVLLKDSRTNGNFMQGIPSLNWILTTAPQLNSSIYIYGTEIYDGLAKKEKDPIRKQKFVDSLMILYDLRIQNCGEEAAVIQRKGMHAAFYNINAKGKEVEVMTTIERAIELNKNDVMDGLLLPYMQVIKIVKLRLKTLTDDQVFEKYDALTGILEAKIKKAQADGKPIDKLKDTKDKVDAILITIVKVDCPFVKKNMEPKFRQNPQDLALAKKIFTFMLQGKCTDDPLWLDAAEVVHKGSTDKDFGLIKVMALKYITLEKFQRADELLKEALQVATTPADKAEILLTQGSVEAKTGSKSTARSLFRQALEADPTRKEVYEKIGDLYYNSSNDCARKENQADDRLVFLIAYDYYARAGESKKMGTARAAFPSKEEIFLVNYKVGDKKSVGCWINEETTIRTRD